MWPCCCPQSVMAVRLHLTSYCLAPPPPPLRLYCTQSVAVYSAVIAWQLCWDGVGVRARAASTYPSPNETEIPRGSRDVTINAPTCAHALTFAVARASYNPVPSCER